MIATIEVTGGDYEHTLGVAGIRNGINIRYVTAPLNSVFIKMLNERCYEACEFSLSNYLMLKDRGADWLHAIPVFPYRAFRHSSLYVCTESPLSEPADLLGKRVGVADFSMTAAVWTRGILADQYGVQWQDLRWVIIGKQRFNALPGVKLESVDGDLEALLVEGRIDALLAPQIVDDGKPAGQRKFRSLITDVQTAEEAYFRAYGIYPINHVVVIRDDVLQRLPGLPRALFEAYEEAKTRAYTRRLGTTFIPWAARHWKTTLDLFGTDPLPYGLNDTNRKVINTLARFLHEQKLIEAQPILDLLFTSEI